MSCYTHKMAIVWMVTIDSVTSLHQGRHQVKICGVDRGGECGARAYNGGLEAEPTGPTPHHPFPL